MILCLLRFIVSLFLLLLSSELKTVLWMWTHKYLIKGKNVSSDLLPMLLMLPSECLAFNSTGACCYHMFNSLSTRSLGVFSAKLLCSSWPSACISFGIFPCQVQVFAFIFDFDEVSVKPFLHFVTIPLNGNPTPHCIDNSPQPGVICELSWGMFCIIASVFNKDIKHDQTLRNVTL